MLRNRFHFIYLLIILFGHQNVFSQDNILNLINERYSLLDSWSLKAKVSIFKKENDLKPFLIMHTSSMGSSDGTLVINDGVEVLMNKNSALIIDHKEKTIQYSKSNFKSKSKSNLDLGNKLVMYFDSTQTDYVNSVLILENGDVNIVCNAKNRSAEITEARYYFRKESLELYRVVFKYSPNSLYKKVITDYTLFEMNIPFNSNTFSESKYLKGTGKNAIVLEKYANYDFYNQYGKTLNDYLNEK